MGEAKLCGKSGGLNLNGNKEGFYVYAGQTIKSGDFVDFVRGVASSTSATSTPKKLGVNIWSVVLSATKLTDTAVFLAYGQYVSSSEYNLYGVVVTLNKTTVTVGTPVKLDTNEDAPYYIASVALTSSKVFITYTGGVSVSLRAIVCTISGTSITAGTAVSLFTNTQSGYSVNAVRLSDTKVFISHQYDRDDEYLYGLVCTISGTSIKAGTNTSIIDSSYATIHDPILIGEDKIFIAHGNSASRFVYGKVVAINNTSLTVGTSIQLTTKTACWGMRAVKVNNLVFVVHTSYDSTNKWYNLYGEVCEIFGTGVKVTVPTTQVVAEGIKYSGNNMPSTSFTLLAVPPSNNAVLIHPATSDNTIYTRVFEIARTVITQKTAMLYATNESVTVAHSIRGINLTDEIFFTVYFCEDSTDTNNVFIPRIKLFGMASDYSKIDSTVAFRTYETQVKKATTDEFNGVATTSGKGGTVTAHSGSVKVYSFSPFEKTKTGTAPIVVDNVLADLPANLSLQGNTTQYYRTGKNLLRKLASYHIDSSSYGVTFRVNNDESLTISGQNTGSNNSAKFFWESTTNPLIFPAGTYNVSKTGSNGLNVTAYDNKKSKYYEIMNNNMTSITFSEEMSFSQVYAQVPKGNTTVFDNFVFRPIITKSSESITPYEPYGFSPSPVFPSESRSFGDTDNLFDSDYSLVTKGGLVKQSDGSYYLSAVKVVNGIWNNDAGFVGRMTIRGEMKWTNYSNHSGEILEVQYTDGTKTSIRSNFNTDYRDKWGIFCLRTDETKVVKQINLTYGGAAQSYFRNVMVTRGDEIIPYKPYGDNTTTVIVRGKNYVREINGGGNMSVNNGKCTQSTADTKTAMQWKIIIKQNGTLVKQTAIWNEEGLGIKKHTFTKDSTFNQLFFGLNGSTRDSLVYVNVDNLKNGKTYTLQWNVLNTTQGSVAWDKVQIEEGSSPTAYRSYVSPKLISVPLGDVRLRSTPDGAHDKFVRVNGVWNKEENVTYEVLNGSEGWSGWAEYPRFYIANAKFADVGNQSGVTSNKFKNRSYDGLYSSQGKQFCMSLSNGTTGGTHRLFATVDSSVVTFASVAEFKTWLAANPTDICYHRATPIYTPITDYELTNVLDELENLILQNGYNNIEVETVNGVAPFIDLDYKAYKK